MPQEPLSLLRSSRREVCEQILDLCEHRARHCKSLRTLGKGFAKEWKTFLVMKNRYLLPVHQRNVVELKCLYAWNNGHSKNRLSTEVWAIGEFLIRYFCFHEYSEWSFELFSNNRMIIDALVRLKPRIKFLKISCNLSEAVLNSLFSTMTNIAELHLPVCDDNGFLIIGRHCLKLKHLNVYDEENFTVTVDRVRRLCYKNFPEDTVQNSICKTLDILDASCTPGGLKEILNHIPNVNGLKISYHLSSIGILDYRIRTLGFPFYLRDEIYSTFSISAKEESQKFYEDFPNIGILAVFGKLEETLQPNPYVPKLLIEFPEVDYNIIKPFEIFELPPLWTNVRLLAIEFNIQDPHRIDMRRLSDSCPNLTFLHISNCTEIVGKKSSAPFSKLEKLYLSDVVLANGPNILSKTCRRLKFLWIYEECKWFENSVAWKNLNSNRYPCLKSLKCSPAVKSSKENILNFLKKFPELKTFGCITDESFRDDFQQECDRRNLDLKIVSSFEDFHNCLHCDV